MLCKNGPSFPVVKTRVKTTVAQNIDPFGRSYKAHKLLASTKSLTFDLYVDSRLSSCEFVLACDMPAMYYNSNYFPDLLDPIRKVAGDGST